MPSRGVGRPPGQPGQRPRRSPGNFVSSAPASDTLRSRGHSLAAPAGEGETFETAPPLSPAAGRLEGGVRRHATPPRLPRTHAASLEKFHAPAPGVVSLRRSEVGPASPTSILPSILLPMLHLRRGPGGPTFPRQSPPRGEAGSAVTPSATPIAPRTGRPGIRAPTRVLTRRQRLVGASAPPQRLSHPRSRSAATQLPPPRRIDGCAPPP